ncbi:MAG: site-2 protease family protein [Candidatus Rokuibacteriota bacterium]
MSTSSHAATGLRVALARGRGRPLALFGIPITLDLSWPFAFALATWTFADSVLPAAAPGRGLAAYISAGVVVAALILLSLAMHEAAHGMAARHAGVGVTGVSLSMLGGATILGHAPRTPGAAFRIAAAGPLASLVCAVAAAIVHVVLVETGGDPLAIAGAAVVALANAVVAVVNLLPGRPLDGGHILEAVVWKLTGHPARGARLATAAGRAIGILAIIVALIASASGDVAAALWSGLLGVVIWNAA